MEAYYVTKERLEELKAELEFLKTKKRQEVGERLRQAKEFGDLSENFEYTEARDEQSRLEARIFEFEDTIKNAVIISKKVSDVVTVGCMVTIKKKDGKSVTYEIVGSDEAKPEQGKISNESPLGRAFLGHKVGDTITVSTPAGDVSYQITKIE